MAIAQPVWSRVDEAQHADFIIQLSHGIYPAANATAIDHETLKVMELTGVYSVFSPGTYPTPDPTDIGPPPAGMTSHVNAAWMSRHLWSLSIESVQTPFFYMAMVPVWSLVDQIGGPLAAIYAIRIICALLVATLAPMTIAAARTLFPSRPEVASLSALLAILLPGLDLNATRISNDALATAVGGLFVLLAIRSTGTTWTWRRAALMGLLLGVGMMVKVTLAGLAPALVLAAILPAVDISPMARIGHAAASGLLALLCLVPWFLVNLRIYGAFTPGALANRLSAVEPGPVTAAFIPFNLAVFHLTYWTGEPWGVLPLGLPFAILGGLIALSSLVGLLAVYRQGGLRAFRGPISVAVLAILGLAGVGLLLPVTSGYEFASPGRYAYPALPASASLCALGIVTVLKRPAIRRIAAVAYTLVAAGMLGAGALGLPAPAEPGPGKPPTDAKMIAVAGSGRFGGVTISVDGIALDAPARATWFEVRLSNTGPSEAEWTVPVASPGGVSAQYFKSTRLPGDVDSGRTVSGWLWVPLDPRTLYEGESIRLRFPDVAPGGYASVGDIDVDIVLSGLTN
ncbi:MAG: hypothetical protein ABI334_10210 [Candidatus Dormiibacterota bacterium]